MSTPFTANTEKCLSTIPSRGIKLSNLDARMLICAECMKPVRLDRALSDPATRSFHLRISCHGTTENVVIPYTEVGCYIYLFAKYRHVKTKDIHKRSGIRT